MASSDCCVYVISLDQEKGPSKVGITQNPRKRLSGLQTAHHQKLTLVGYWDVPNREIARAIEESFHTVQVEHRLAGEWFDIPPGRCMALIMFSIAAALHVHTNFTSDEINEILEVSRTDCVEAA